MTTESVITYAPLHAHAILNEEIPCAWYSTRRLASPTWQSPFSCGGIGGPAPTTKVIVLSPFYPPSHRPSFSTRIERYRSDLERLRDGWCGPGSRAPTPETLADLDRLLAALPSDTTVPEIEVNEDSGSVTLRWQGSFAKALSFVVSGSGQVLAVTTTLAADPIVVSRRFAVSHTDAIARFIESDTALAAVIAQG